MNKKETIELIIFANAAGSTISTDEITINTWHLILKNTPLKDALTATHHHLTTNPYPLKPTNITTHYRTTADQRIQRQKHKLTEPHDLTGTEYCKWLTAAYQSLGNGHDATTATTHAAHAIGRTTPQEQISTPPPPHIKQQLKKLGATT